MSDIKIGQLIEGVAHRDAIHMAIAPVKAANLMNPGQHCGISKHGLAIDTEPFVGIVDPFLKAPVKPGEQFYLWLYPGSIKGLRHEWIHPAFEDVPAVPVVDTSERAVSQKWLEDFAKTTPLALPAIMEAAGVWLTYEDYLNCGHLLEGYYVPEEFWTHYQVVKGVVVEESKKSSFFACSC